MSLIQLRLIKGHGEESSLQGPDVYHGNRVRSHFRCRNQLIDSYAFVCLISRHKTQYGGKKTKSGHDYQALPFDHCSLSLAPFETPVCTAEVYGGTVQSHMAAFKVFFTTQIFSSLLCLFVVCCVCLFIIRECSLISLT